MKILFCQAKNDEFLLQNYTTNDFVATGILALDQKSNKSSLIISQPSIQSTIRKLLRQLHNDYTKSHFVKINKENNIPQHSSVVEKGLLEYRILKENEIPSKINTIYFSENYNLSEEYLSLFDVVTIVGKTLPDFEQSLCPFSEELQSYKYVHGRKIDYIDWKFVPFINKFKKRGFRFENKEIYTLKEVNEFARGVYNVMNLHNYFDELREMCGLGSKYGS